MRYVAGIDGGQSSTKAVIIDEDGTVVGSGVAGPADHVGEPPGSRRFADACETALAAARAAAALPPATTFEAVHVGLSGYDEEFDGAFPTFAAPRARVEHDAPIALAGAVQTRPAVVVIAGTGSVAYGEDGEGRSVRVGGWGYQFGDEGSAYAIARDALGHAMRAEDRGAVTALGEAALAFFDRRSLREIATFALTGRIARREIAAFARLVHDAARLGDADAGHIVAAAADALAELAQLAIVRLGLTDLPVVVALSGGAFGGEALFAATEARIVARTPQATVTRGRYEPAVGAALIAFTEAGMAIPDAISA